MKLNIRIFRRNLFFVFVCVVLGTAMASSLSSCASMEPTDDQINAESAKAYNEVKAKSKISKNAEWTKMVDRVASRIAKASDEKFRWEWTLIESPEVNAWCMPGGKIAVYTGIMPVLKTEGALAAVLGHEVAHATKRHGKQRYARAIKGNLLGVGVAVVSVVGGELLCKSEGCKSVAALGGAAAGLAVTFFDRKFSRGDESEADHVGQIYMAKAGYDPNEATNLWDRMSASNKGSAPPEFMSTHPSDAHRKADLQKWLPEANGFYTVSPVKFGTGEAIK